MSAAFDLVDHSILLERMEDHYGVTGVAKQVFQSYLSESFGARHNPRCTYSSGRVPTSGVPQGSVAGPALFNMYIAPLTDVIRAHGVRHHIYADDIQLYFFANPQYSDVQEAMQRLTACVAGVNAWLTSNKLKLNPDKTEFVVFCSKHHCNLTFPSLIVDGNTIHPAKNAKILGVTLDKTMTMTDHVNNVCKTAYFQLRNIRRIRSFITKESCQSIVTCLILSRLDYCNSLYTALSQVLIRKLQKVQNCAVRVIYYAANSDHVTPLFLQLHWLPLSCRIRFKILCIMYKVFNSYNVPSYISDIFTLQSATSGRPYRVQYLNSFYVPRILSKYGERSILYTGPKLWNDLPLSIKACSSFSIFKRTLKTYFFLIYFNV